MRYIGIIIGLFCVLSAWGQVDKKTQLEQQKKDNLAKIKELNSIISRTSKKKNVSIGKLNVLKEQIVVQKKQINVLNENQELLAAEASKLTHESDVLAAKLERLKQHYALMLYEAQKVSTVSNKISFLLLSKDIGEFTRRFDYLRQFTTNRKQQAHKIFETRQDLMTKKQQVVFKKNEEKKVLIEKEKEKATLEVLKTKETKVVTVLTQQEKKLRTELARKKLAIRKLDNLIAGIVQREIQKSIERERKLRMAAQTRKLEVNKPALPKPKLEEGLVKKYEKPNGLDSKDEAKLEVQAEKKESTKPAKKEVPVSVAKVEEPVLNSNIYYMNADEAKLASSFAALRGRMPFPVPSGFISDHFGVHKHPVLKGVMVNNNGIDIQTSAGSPVHTVYDGVVATVQNIPGINMVVAIQHGEYFTVYSKLANVSVSTGQKVKTGQRIGSVASDEDGTSEINFQVWKNTVHQNPESWLRR
ncbi:MAG: peptidoglycan DD-metalloendopeptidase family protein [Bacteroidota bacterium]